MQKQEKRVLGWTHELRELGVQGLDVTREANAAERAAIANHLEVLSCESFKAHYTLRPLPRGRAKLSGRLAAKITQACVVTLDPVASNLEGTFSLELWPEEELPAEPVGTLDALDEDEPEPIRNGVIDVGHVLVESLADLVDPYPRKPGATLSWSDEKAAGDSDNPFARLKDLRRDS